MNEFFKFYKNKKVLITGDTGFTGSWMTLCLSLMGAKIIGFSEYSKKEHVLHGKIRKKIKNYSQNYYDISKKENIQKVINKFKPEIVFHLAAQPLVLDSVDNPVYTFNTNIIGTINLLDSLKNKKFIKNIVVITTDKVYENLDNSKKFKETDKIGGLDPYSSSKACVEIICNSYYNTYFKKNKINLSTVRAGNIIGGGDYSENRIIPDCFKSILHQKTLLIRNPNHTRPWQHVLNVCHAYLLLGMKKNPFEKKDKYSYSDISFNIALKKNQMRVIDLINLVNVKTSAKLKIKIENKSKYKNESIYLSLNSNKLEKKLGFIPKYNEKTSVLKTIEWYEKCYLNESNISAFDFTILQILEYFQK